MLKDKIMLNENVKKELPLLYANVKQKENI